MPSVNLFTEVKFFFHFLNYVYSTDSYKWDCFIKVMNIFCDSQYNSAKYFLLELLCAFKAVIFTCVVETVVSLMVVNHLG